jgi:hypothetical protein
MFTESLDGLATEGEGNSVAFEARVRARGEAVPDFPVYQTL